MNYYLILIFDIYKGIQIDHMNDRSVKKTRNLFQGKLNSKVLILFLSGRRLTERVSLLYFDLRFRNQAAAV